MQWRMMVVGIVFLLKTYKEVENSLLFSIFVVKIRNDD